MYIESIKLLDIHIGKILDDPNPPAMISNRHPAIPNSSLPSGHRMMLHGLDSETLHAYLRNVKNNPTAKDVETLPSPFRHYKNLDAKY